VTEDDKRLIKRIDEHATGLSDWETDFIEQMVRKAENGSPLSPKQRAILERIDEQKVR
jgi:hypothetical protein